MMMNMKTYEEHQAERAEFRASDSKEQLAHISSNHTGLGLLVEVAGRDIPSSDEVLFEAQARLEREARVMVSYYLDNGDELHLFGTDPDGIIAYFVVTTDGDEPLTGGFFYEDTLWEGWKSGKVVEHSVPRPLIEVTERLGDLDY